MEAWSVGGLGIAKNAFVGGALNVAGVATAKITTESTSISSGSLVVSGGVGVAKNAFVGGALNVAGASTLTGIVTAAATTVSNGVSSGSLITSGGLGVAGNAWVGGTLNVAGVATAKIETESTSISWLSSLRQAYVASSYRFLLHGF